ncbi:MAG: hypothetical protein V1816_08530 [Pseudomonadota bacterium]
MSARHLWVVRLELRGFFITHFGEELLLDGADDAIENFRVALELDPSLDWAWQALARLDNSGAE